MSRSYKKTPAISETTIKGGKRLANKKVRRMLKQNHDLILCNKGHYKKILDPWDVRDYREVAPSFEVFCEQQFDRWRKRKSWGVVVSDRPPTVEKLWELYQRWYKRK